MSSLYQTPSEVSKSLNRNTGNFLTDSFTDWVSGGLSIGDDGRIEREGAAWWLQGFTPGAEGIARGNQKLKEARAIDQVVQQSGLSMDEIQESAGAKKLTSSNVTGIVSKALRDVKNKPTPLEQHQMDRQNTIDQASIEATKGQTRLGYAQLAAEQEGKRTDRAMARDQYAFESGERAKDRSLERQLSNDQSDLKMQMAFMDAELQDKRMEYDRETRRMDRRDRMIANLMSGIGQLGAAFAV